MRWLEYHCEDYFGSSLAQHGYFDERGQAWYVWPSNRIYEDSERQFLVVGGPGWDGIQWGYRRGLHGCWAWCPIDGVFQYVAATVPSLLDDWLSGAITL